MSYINLKCKNCNGEMSLNVEAKTIACNHCGKNYLLNELLDEKDLELINQMNSTYLTNKIQSNSYAKDGDAYIYQAEYEKAEEIYKKAIELDETNCKAYFGVVRAKTHNLNIIPEEKDYKEYEKKALEYASFDEKEHIKQELSKLRLLEAEKKQIDKEIKVKATKKNKELAKIKYEKTLNKIAYASIFVITATILILILVL